MSSIVQANVTVQGSVYASTLYGQLAGSNALATSNVLVAYGLPASIVQGSNVAVFSNAAGGSNVLVMNSLGQVGIGTTNPATVLQVAGPLNTGGGANRSTPYANAYASVTSDIGYGTTAQVGIEVGSARRDAGDLASPYKYVLNTINNSSLGAGVDFQILAVPSASGSYTSDGTALNRMTIRYNGNVGIGTSPSYTLDISYPGGVTNQAQPFLRLGNPTGGASATCGIHLMPWTGRTGGPSSSIIAIDDGSSSSHLSFYTAAAGSGSTQVERMRIQNNGYVGIGTQNPSYPLEISGIFKYTNYGFRFTTAGGSVALTNNARINYTVADSAFPYTTITNGGFLTPVAGLWSFTSAINLDNSGTATTYRVGIGITSTDTTSISFSGANSMDTLTWFRATISQEYTSAALNNETLSCIYYCPVNTYVKVYVCASSAPALKTYSWPNPTNYFTGYLISA